MPELRFLECTDIPNLMSLGRIWYEKLAKQDYVWHAMCEQLGRQYVLSTDVPLT